MPLRVAIIGCGKIADAHAAQIRGIKGCDLVGVCDREKLMARQLAERFEVPRCFDDLGQLLRDTRPDVVHVTTPPQSHLSLARLCLEHGSHVYVEKPFTVDAAEAETLISLAERRGLKLTVGHDAQFRPQVHGTGALGGHLPRHRHRARRAGAQHAGRWVEGCARSDAEREVNG